MILPWSGTFIPDDWPRPVEPYCFRPADVPELFKLFFDEMNSIILHFAEMINK